MARGEWTIDRETGKLIPYEGAKKRENASAYVITDDVPEGIQSMVTKRWYTSKGRLRQEYKDLGHIEIGNTNWEPEKVDDPNRDRDIEIEVEKAYYAVRDGMAPLTELDRERCKMANHNLEHYNYDRREFDDDGNPLG